MLVKTKKYQLEVGTYIKAAFFAVIKQQWWAHLIALAIMAMYFIIPSHWWITGALIALVVYYLFWLVQFAGVTQMEQSKMLFEKLSYEITSQQLLIKLNSKQGMPMKWDMIKRVKKTKTAYILFASKAQLIYLPFKIFNTENELKFTETILNRKGLL